MEFIRAMCRQAYPGWTKKVLLFQGVIVLMQMTFSIVSGNPLVLLLFIGACTLLACFNLGYAARIILRNRRSIDEEYRTWERERREGLRELLEMQAVRERIRQQYIAGRTLHEETLRVIDEHLRRHWDR